MLYFDGAMIAEPKDILGETEFIPQTILTILREVIGAIGCRIDQSPFSGAAFAVASVRLRSPTRSVRPAPLSLGRGQLLTNMDEQLQPVFAGNFVTSENLVFFTPRITG